MFLNFKMNEGDVCLADCATTHTILREKIYFFNLITTNTSVGTISGTSNLIEGSGRANIVLPNGTRFHINDVLCNRGGAYYYYFGYMIHIASFGPVLPRNNLLFSVHSILNELSPNHFLTFEIFVKISSLESLTTYHPENRKNFRLFHNSTKLFWVTRFRETNLMAQFVSSSEI